MHVRPLLAAAAMTGATLLVPAPAQAAALPCNASMSNARPQQYSNVVVRVRTASKATVRTVAHDKTTDTSKNRKANNAGRADVGCYISGASIGHQVRVDVTVKKAGKTRSCSRSFVPKR